MTFCAPALIDLARLGLHALGFENGLMQRHLSRQLFFVGLMFSCITEAAVPERVLFVVMGGYNSCPSSSRSLPPHGMGMYPPFKKLETKLAASRSGMAITTLVSCLEAVAPPDGEALYVVSDSPTKLQYGDSDKILSQVKGLLAKYPNAPLFIAGHSYGGWMAMYLAEQIQSPQFKGLFTIDPISPACGPLEVAFGSSECHSAPDDLDNSAIAAHAARWVNFYQTADAWLTSSKITQADENHFIDYEWGPHRDVDSDKRTWKRIELATFSSLTP